MGAYNVWYFFLVAVTGPERIGLKLWREVCSTEVAVVWGASGQCSQSCGFVICFFGWSYLEPGVGLGDSYGSPPNKDILWFCDFEKYIGRELLKSQQHLPQLPQTVYQFVVNEISWLNVNTLIRNLTVFLPIPSGLLSSGSKWFLLFGRSTCFLEINFWSCRQETKLQSSHQLVEAESVQVLRGRYHFLLHVL